MIPVSGEHPGTTFGPAPASKPCRWWAPWRHKWREIERVWWSLGPPGFECYRCGKREWLDP